MATRLSIEVLSNFVPFLLLRPVSSAHLASPSVFNREIVTDRILAGATVLLAGLIYHVTLFVALKWFLADTLVLYFDGIETVQPANEATVYGTLPMAALSVLFGLAARTFIFTPFATQAPTEADAEIVQFDPVRATMFETLWWNLWGYTASTKVAITRSAVVSLLTGLGTFVQCVLTIRGVGAYGAATYSAAWSLAALTTGSVLRWVGDV